MRITVYLPDDLGERARAAGINFSGVLRAAVEHELAGDTGMVVSARRIASGVEVVVRVREEALRAWLEQ